MMSIQRLIINAFPFFFVLAFGFFFTSNPHAVFAQVACTSKFPISGTENLLYCANKDIETADATVKRLIIVVHGTNRNADTYFASMTSAADGAGSTDSLIIAPRFTMQGDVSDSDVPLWTNDGWKSGDPSQNGQTSSYTAIDELIKHIVDGKKFPNLQLIIVTGHSAGGQFTHRYAAGTQIEQAIGAITVRFIIANPSSYLYFTPERPVSGSETQFAVPSGSSCSDYDTYKYGFTGLNPYVTAIGPDKIKAQYKNKNVIYLLGDQDIDPQESSLDTSCAGEVQGAYRFQRGSAYYNYLGHIYDQFVYTTHIKAVVPSVAHDNNAMYNSDVAKQYLFGAITAPTLVPSPFVVVPTYVCAGSNTSICVTQIPTIPLVPTSQISVNPVPTDILQVPSIAITPIPGQQGGGRGVLGSLLYFLLLILGFLFRIF